MYRRILVATDGSQLSTMAVARVATMPRRKITGMDIKNENLIKGDMVVLRFVNNQLESIPFDDLFAHSFENFQQPQAYWSPFALSIETLSKISPSFVMSENSSMLSVGNKATTCSVLYKR